MSVTTACENVADVSQPEHDRCPGATYETWLSEGKPCECPCHSLPRCFSVYVGQGASAYFCDRHLGHGGSYHRDRFVLWGRDPQPSDLSTKENDHA